MSSAPRLLSSSEVVAGPISACRCSGWRSTQARVTCWSVQPFSFGPHGRAAVLAADSDPLEPVLAPVLLRVADPLVAPARSPDAADAPGRLSLVQRFHHRPDRRILVILVQDVDVHLAELHRLEAD